MNLCKQIRCARKILNRQFKKKCLARQAGRAEPANLRVVPRTLRNCVIEDRGIGSQPGDRQRIDVTLERSGIEQVSCDVVEPETLGDVVQMLSSFHEDVLSEFRIFQSLTDQLLRVHRFDRWQYPQGEESRV